MVSLGTPPFSASSSWNTPVSNNATFTKLNWPASTGYNYTVAWDTYSPSVYVASPSDPLVQVTYPPGWGYPGGTISVHMPAAANGAAGTDGELIVIDGDVAYNFWQFKRIGTTSGTAASFGAENVVTGDGWGSKSPFLSAGITAVGSSQLGGLLIKAETADGSIDHALQLAVDSKLVLPGAVGNAIASDGSSASGMVREGQLLAIPKDTPMPAGLSPLGQEVFLAMQKYGAYVVDTAGGATNIRVQANDFDDATMTALWHDMGKLTPLLAGVSDSGSNNGNTGSDNPGGVTTPPTGTPNDTTAPIVQWVATNGPGVTNGSGTVGVGDTVRLAVKFSEAVNVTGAPSLSLNNNGVAKYVSGSGSDVLQFDYKVTAGQNTADLAISGYSLAGITDLAGNAVNLTGAPKEPGGTLIVDARADSIAPTVQWVATNGPGITDGNGTVGVGDTVRLAVKFNEAVNVTGAPSLSLNNNGVAKYVSGSGSDVLQFDYKVTAGQNTADLAISGYSLAGITDLAGNTVNLTGAPKEPGGTLIVDARTDSIAPTVQWIATNGPGITDGNGTVGVGNTVRLAVKFSEAVNVTGAPSLALNDNGIAKYVSGSGSDVLQFDYKVAAGQNTADLAISGYSLAGITDLAGNAVNLAGAPKEPAGTLIVDTRAPNIQWIAATGSGISNGNGVVGNGGTVRLSVNFNEAVTVNGTPTLSLNSNGTAKYVSGSGTNTLQFDYKVAAGQTASDLAVSRYNLSGVTDRAGNAVDLSNAPYQPAGTLAIRATSSNRSAATLNSAAATNLTAAASAVTPTDTSSSNISSNGQIPLSASLGGNDKVSSLLDGLGNQTLGYSATQNETASPIQVNGSLMPQLALLTQYAASSFVASAPASTGTVSHEWWGSTVQTLTKPLAK